MTTVPAAQRVRGLLVDDDLVSTVARIARLKLDIRRLADEAGGGEA